LELHAETPEQHACGGGLRMPPDAPVPGRCVVADQKVLQHGHRRHQAQMLVHEGNAEPQEIARLQGQRHRLSANPQHSARLRFVEPGQNLDEGRFARTVLAEKAMHLAGLDRERNVVERQGSAKALRQMRYLEDGRGVPGRRAHGSRCCH
jgi:hypothetical protein